MSGYVDLRALARQVLARQVSQGRRFPIPSGGRDAAQAQIATVDTLLSHCPNPRSWAHGTGPIRLLNGRDLWRLPAPIGKTGQVSELVRKVRSTGSVLLADGRTLVICGRAVPSAWIDELAMHAGAIVDYLLSSCSRAERSP